MKLIKLLFSFIKKLLTKKEYRFLLIGGLNTAVGYGSYAVLVFTGVGYDPAYTISTIVGVVHSFFWNKFYTFKNQSSKSMSLAEAIRFIIVYLVSYLIGKIFIAFLIDDCGINELLAGAINLIITTLISWFGHNYFSFKSNNKKELDKAE